MMQIESEFELFLAFARETIADVLFYVIVDLLYGLKKRNFVVFYFPPKAMEQHKAQFARWNTLMGEYRQRRFPFVFCIIFHSLTL